MPQFGNEIGNHFRVVGRRGRTSRTMSVALERLTNGGPAMIRYNETQSIKEQKAVLKKNNAEAISQWEEI